jgi:nitrogen-specific signal transduction histidine kinase
MNQLEYVTITLVLISLVFSVVFFHSWLVFDRQKHALTWSICFGVAAALGLDTIAGEVGWIPYNLYWSSANFMSLTVPVLALLGHMQRAKFHLPVFSIVGLVLIPFFIAMLATYIQPHFGISSFAQPFQNIIVSIWTIRIIYLTSKSPSKIAWAIIFGYVLLAVSQTWLGAIALSYGVDRVEQVADFHNFFRLISVPSYFTLLGLLSLLLIATDLSEKVRKLAEYQRLLSRKAVEQNEVTLQEAIEAVPDLVAIADEDANYVTCNEVFAGALELSKRQISLLDARQVLTLYSALLLSIDGEIVASEAMIKKKLLHALESGKRLKVITQKSQIYILGINYLSSGGTILVARDVTQLNNAQTRLEAAIKTMPTGFAYSEEGRVIACNESYENLIQKDRDWIVHQPFEVLIKSVQARLTNTYSAEDLEKHLQSLLKSIQKRELFNEVLQFDNGDWYEISINPVLESGFITIATDITQRKLFEIGVEESEEQLRAILGSQPFPVLILNPIDSSVIYASKSALEVLGELDSEGEAAGNQAQIRSNASVAFLAASTTVLTDSGISEVTLQRSTGEKFPALLSTKNIWFTGKPARIVSFIDISIIKKLQSELESQREALLQSENLNALNDLLTGVAHDLNNPLTVIMANSHLLGKTSTDEKSASQINGISEAAERCAKIIRLFLEMARSNPDRQARFSIATCIEQALDVASVGLKVNQIAIDADVQPDLPTVLGPQHQFTQVILGLIINSQQALSKTSLPRNIYITAKLNNDKNLIVIDVWDSGPRIADEIAGSHFTNKSSGEDASLSMAQEILASLKGAIHVIKITNEGAHFQILLPHSGLLTAVDKTLF